LDFNAAWSMVFVIGEPGSRDLFDLTMLFPIV